MVQRLSDDTLFFSFQFSVFSFHDGNMDIEIRVFNQRCFNNTEI